jgi:predicted nucleic acid-binding protein
MNIIVDTSTIIAVIVNEPEREHLVQLTIGADLVAPGSVHWEIGNAFSAMLKPNRLSLSDALASIRAYQSIPIRWVDVELDEALRLAERLDIYAYDAYLLRCAEEFNAPLLTLDKTLREHAQAINLSILEW